jgi:5-bromo-4-chloroindolyl phosphate hydrolysis protein
MKSLILLFVLLGICLVLVGPILTIMSLNYLFNLDIPINIWSWLATLWLAGIVSGFRMVSYKKE